MCGRFSITIDATKLLHRFKIARGPDEIPVRYNLAPTQQAPVVDMDHTLHLMQWGLIPAWSKDSKFGAKMINARSETVREKPSFRGLLKAHRCLVLADGFYEWKHKGSEKIPYRFEMETGEPFAFAGIWTTWRELDTFTILTTTANRVVGPVHERMPVILRRADEERWLDPEVKEFDDMLGPYPSNGMVRFLISDVVNNVANDTPECLAPVQES